MSGWQDYLFIIILLGILFWSMTRRRKTGSSPADLVVGLLGDVNENLRILDERMKNWQSRRKFLTRSWEDYKDKMGFLDPTLVSALNESFTLEEDFNSRIDSARNNKMMATLQDMPLEKLSGPLNKSKDGLTAWLRSSDQTEQQYHQRRGCSPF